MKIKVSTSPIYNLIFFLAIMDCGIFELFNIPILKESGYTTTLVAIISIFLFINCIVNKKANKALKPYQNFINAYLAILVIFIAIVSIYSLNRYNQSLVEIFICFRSYLYLFMVSPLIFLFINQNGYEGILKVIIGIVIFVLAIKLLAAFAYNFFGKNILRLDTIELRYGRYRTGLPPLFGISVSYIIYKIFEEKLQKNKLKWFLLLAFIYFFEFYVNMTRMYIISILLTTLIMYLLRPRAKTNQAFIWIIAVSAIVLLVASGEFTEFLETFSETNEETGASTLARQNAREYFSLYTDDNMFLSMGFVCPTTTYYTKIYFGPTLTSCFDDLGIANMWYHYGLAGVVIAAIICVRLIYLFIKIYYFTDSDKKLLIAGTTFFLASTQTSLSMFDGQRIFNLVFCWAMFEYEAMTAYKKRERKLVKFTTSRKSRNQEA